jgi:GntR family transcriptional regulator
VNSSTETSTVLDRSSESPLWAQFRDALRLQILQGVLPIGAKLPSEAELGEQFGISRIVVREALADLVRNNLIYKIKGRGAFVSARERDEDFVSTVLGFSDEMERKGRSVRTQILTQELRAPTGQEATSLGLTDDTQVVALKRLRSVDGELRLLVETGASGNGRCGSAGGPRRPPACPPPPPCRRRRRLPGPCRSPSRPS